MKKNLQQLTEAARDFKLHASNHFYILGITSEKFYNIKVVAKREGLIAKRRKSLFVDYHPDLYSGDEENVRELAKVCEQYILNAVNALTQKNILYAQSARRTMPKSRQAYTTQSESPSARKRPEAAPKQEKEEPTFAQLLQEKKFFATLQHKDFNSQTLNTQAKILNAIKEKHCHVSLFEFRGQLLHGHINQYLQKESSQTIKAARQTAYRSYVANKETHYENFLRKNFEDFAKTQQEDILRHKVDIKNKEQRLKDKHEPVIRRWTTIASFCEKYLFFIKPLVTWTNNKYENIIKEQKKAEMEIPKPIHLTSFEAWKEENAFDIDRWTQDKGYASVQEYIQYQHELNEEPNSIKKQCLQAEYLQQVKPVIDQYREIEVSNTMVARQRDAKIGDLKFTAKSSAEPAAPEYTSTKQQMVLG